MNLKYENKKLSEGYKYVIGCDEVGRGCLAGPVVAAAVVIPRVKYKELSIMGIKDSKLLSGKKRKELSVVIKDFATAWSAAEVSPAEIDRINIHHASLLAMRKAIEGLVSRGVILRSAADEESLRLEIAKGKGSFDSSDAFLAQDETQKMFVYIDGKFTIPSFAKATEGKPKYNYNIEQCAIVGGDNKVLSIAAASIIAKVYRDELMEKLDKQYPGYGLAKHKGYATKLHRDNILKKGLSRIHRVSFCKKLVK